MLSNVTDGVAALPTFVALDVRAVLANERRGASIQIDDGYFRGQQLAIDVVETPSSLTDRQTIVSQSYRGYNQIQIDIDSLSHETLWSASVQYRNLLQQLPEVQYLKRWFPGTCFVVPEWLRTPGAVEYGARVYFFRDRDSPEPTDILDQNIDAVVTEDNAEFERYQGDLLGYPECCFDYFSDHGRYGKLGPELAAVEPIVDAIDDSELTRGGERPKTSVDDIVGELADRQHFYAFFTREFYPEPDCDQARNCGVSIYETLCDIYPESVVEDHFRLNTGWSYLVAQLTAPDTESQRRPSPGILGREHLLFYLPLAETVRLYSGDETST